MATPTARAKAICLIESIPPGTQVQVQACGAGRRAGDTVLAAVVGGEHREATESVLAGGQAFLGVVGGVAERGQGGGDGVEPGRCGVAGHASHPAQHRVDAVAGEGDEQVAHQVHPAPDPLIHDAEEGEVGMDAGEFGQQGAQPGGARGWGQPHRLLDGGSDDQLTGGAGEPVVTIAKHDE